ncbi:MAG: WD40 repeat domain-containing protein [Planctomycetota bacterium]
MPDVDPSRLRKGLLSEVWYVELTDYVIDMQWSPNAVRLAAVTVEGGVFLIEDIGDSATFKLIGCHGGGANSVSWRHDGAEFATAGHDGLVNVWDGTSGVQLDSLQAGTSWVTKAIYSPRRNVLATAAGRHLKLFNNDRAMIYHNSDHPSTIADIGWNPQGPGIAAAANHGVTLHLSEAAGEPRRFRWKGSSLVLQWSPDAKYLVTGEQDATIHFWYLATGKDAEISGYSTKVQLLDWDSGGRLLATGGGSTVVLWDCGGAGPAGSQPIQLKARGSRLTQVAFQPGGSMLASTDNEGFAFLWEPMEHDRVVGGVLLSSAASCLRWYSEDRLAVGQQDGKVVVFEVRP